MQKTSKKLHIFIFLLILAANTVLWLLAKILFTNHTIGAIAFLIGTSVVMTSLATQASDTKDTL